MIIAAKARRAVGVAPGTTTFQLNGDATCPADMARGTPGVAVDLSWMLQPPAANVVNVNAKAPQALIPSFVKTNVPMPPAPMPNVYSKSLGPVPDAVEKLTEKVSTAAKRMLSPYATFENLFGARRRRGLGLVLSPYGDISPEMYSEISATHQNYRNHCGPFDPQFNTRGEAGLYYDTPLGSNVPTDFQVSRTTGYTPVVNSWVPFKQNTWTMAPWVPPHGGGAYATIGPPLRGRRRRGWLDALKSSLLGAADGALDVDAGLPEIATTAVTAEYNAGRAAVDELRRHQDRVFFLSVVSTAAVAGGFLLNVIKDQREKRNVKKSTTYDTNTVPVAGARRRRKRSR